MINNYISLDSIIEKINRFKIPGGYWNIDELKEWTYDALSAINTIEDKVELGAEIDIIDNKGLLPSNMTIIKGIYESESMYPMTEIHIGEDFYQPLQYKIFNGYIYTYTDFVTGFVTINYLGHPEKDNAPLIPDNRYYIKAIESFIKYKIGERSFWQSKIVTGQLHMLEQEWLFYLPAARNINKMDILNNSKKFRKISNRHFM